MFVEKIKFWFKRMVEDDVTVSDETLESGSCYMIKTIKERRRLGWNLSGGGWD